MSLHTTTKLLVGLPFKRFMLNSKCRPQCIHSNCMIRAVHGRWKSTDSGKNESNTSSTGKELDIARESPYAGLSMGEKVKEASKDATYLGFSVVAVGVLGAMVYYIGTELFSGQSPNGVYSKALKDCTNNTEIKIALGEPIKGYGETTRRGRRRHVSHTEFVTDDRQHMRMQFHIQGPDKKATVHLEVVKNDSGKYSYRYLFAQIDQFPHRTIIIEDNR